MTTSRATRLAAFLCTATWGAAFLGAQTPVDPPPWWGIADDDTVSLYWSFDGPVPTQPDLQIVPSWYVPPPNNGFTLSPNIVQIPTLAGHTGVLGFTGAGTGTISLVVDNDPRPDWIKIFWLQFDSFETASGTVAAAIRQDLAKYERAIVSEDSETLGGGWSRTTIGALLIPQPLDEAIDFTLTEQALASVAIDDLYVDSKCVKPPPDETGDALGQTDDTLLNVDLGSATGNADCSACALTQDQNGTLTYWVAGRGTGTSHPVFRLDANGVQVGNAVQLPTAQAAPLGATDLAVARLPGPGGTRRTLVFGVLDRRAAQGDVALLAIDAATATFDPVRTIPVPGYTGTGPLGLAFSPHGDRGAGTFWISEQGGTVAEVALDGTIRRTLTPLQNDTPPGIGGAGYDEYTGRFYWFSSAPLPTPQGPFQVNGFVHSAYDLQPTGTRFFGDLRLQNPAGPRGGVARGLEVVRLRDGRLRLPVVQRLGTRSQLVVLAGPYPFGWNLLGRCGMAGDPPMEGAANFQVTLSGVPRARFATLYAGFNNRTWMGQQLPFDLGLFGLPESNLSVAPLLNSVLLPVASGRAAFTVPLLPPGSGFRYVPMFFQWVVFDPSAPGGIATSQAGKTVIY